MKVTMEYIARMANVSKATVSRVINGKTEGVGEETRKRVLEVIREYDYAPGYTARGISPGKTKTIYKLTTSIAVGVAATRSQVVTSGLLRLMWPMMTLVVALVMFRKEYKVSKWFAPSILLSVVGILVANTDVDNFSVFNTLRLMFVDAFWPSVLSIISSVAWGVYSNLNRKIVGEEDYDAVGLFMIVTGLVSYAVTLFVAEPQVLQLQQMGELFYMIVLSSFLGTLLWNLSMQKGNHMLVILVSNFTPVFATVVSAVLLHVELTWPMVLGSCMVVAGTIFSKLCITSVKPEVV